MISEIDNTFDIAFKYSAIGMALVSPEGRWLRVNDCFLKFVLYNESDLIGNSTLEITFDEDREQTKAMISALLSGATLSENIEKRYKRKDGNIVWAEISVALIRDENGHPLYFLSQIQDITPRKIAEAKLKESEARFDLAMKGSNAGLWDWDCKSENLYFSPRFKAILGITDPDFSPTIRLMEELLHPDDRERRAMAIDLHIKAKIPYNIEYRMKHGDGHYVWIQSRGQAAWNKEGTPIRMASSVEDISHRKLIEKELSQSEERLALVVQNTTDGIWDWNNIGTQDEEIYWSPQMFKLIGCRIKNPNPSYQYLLDKLHPQDKEELESAVYAHLKKGEIFDVQFRLETEDQRYEWFNARGSKSINDRGNVRFTGSVTNIDEQKKSDAKLEEYMRELERINGDLDDFAYIASHDLNEPLRGLSNNALFLKEDYQDKLDEKALQRLDRIMFLCKRMEKLVNDLLHFARIKNQELQIQKVDLNNVIEDIRVTLDHFLAESNAEILVPRRLPRVICDEVIITELFRNLIVNGIKYNDNEKKIIEIGYHNTREDDSSESKIELYIKDNGIGIPREHQKDIFRIFKRLDDREDSIRGTGIGLTFVKKIVERHNGKIWLESQPGSGSIFHFTIS